MEELSGPCALLDQLADIDAACGDDAVERRVDLLERLSTAPACARLRLAIALWCWWICLGGEVFGVLRVTASCEQAL